MPPAAKGTRSLWKPFWVYVIRDGKIYIFPVNTLPAKDRLDVSILQNAYVEMHHGPGVSPQENRHIPKTNKNPLMGFPKGVTPFGRRRQIKLLVNFK